MDISSYIDMNRETALRQEELHEMVQELMHTDKYRQAKIENGEEPEKFEIIIEDYTRDNCHAGTRMVFGCFIYYGSAPVTGYQAKYILEMLGIDNLTLEDRTEGKRFGGIINEIRRDQEASF